MKQLIVCLFLFLTPHMVSMVNHRWCNKVAIRMGEWTWRGSYSLISIVGLVLIIIGYGEARLISGLLHTSPTWSSYFVALTMLPVFILLIAEHLTDWIQKLGAYLLD